MKHSKFTIDIKTISKKRVLGLLTFLFAFSMINSIQTTSAKSSNLLNAKLNAKFEADNSLAKEKSKLKGIEDQDITINILNNETYFIGSAQGKIKLKQNQINLKNKNYYGSVLNVAFNETQVKNLTEQRKNNTHINLFPVNHLNDFFDYFPNFGKMKGTNEMELDLRYIWNCTYEQREDSNSVAIVMNLISKESATQHGFKVEFRFNSEKNTNELLRDYFQNLMKVCNITQKSAFELRGELHKLIVKSINIKKHIEKAGEAKSNIPNGNNSEGKKVDGNVFDKNPSINDGQNSQNPIAPNPSPENPQAGGGAAPDNQNAAAPEAQNANGDAGQQPPESVAKISGKVNNKVLKVASFLQIKEQVKNEEMQNQNTNPISNNNVINNQNNNNNSNPNTTVEEPHIHSKDTIVSDKADNKVVKPEDITDPLARQKYQKAQSDLTKNQEKLKLLADKKKEIVKSINDLYNKINSELQSKDILLPQVEMDKSKLEKAQQVIEQTKKESERIRKQSESFIAEKQALNSTQEAKKKETHVLEKTYQEQKGKFDEINQKKKDTADSISQYNSNGELAAKKLKADMEKKIALQKQTEKLQMSIEKTAKEIEEKSQDVKSSQQVFDNLNNKVEKLKNEIKLFEESQKNTSKKQDDIGKQIDTAEAEKLKKQSYEALTKLSVLDEPLQSAKKGLLDLVDSGLASLLENSFNMVIDKDNNDLSAFEREMTKIPKFVWTPNK